MGKQDIRPIGEYIAELRKKNGYSQAELAKKLFLTPQAISALERNSSNLSLELAVAICKEFDLPLSAFHERSLESDGFTPIPSEDELAKRLTDLRKAKGLDRKTVAEQSGLSERTIRNYENGDASPSFQFLEKAADIYGVSFEELFAIPKKKKPFVVPVWVWWVIGVTVAAGSGGGVTALVVGMQNKKSPTPTSTTSIMNTSEGGSGETMSSTESSSSSEEESSSESSSDYTPVGRVHYDIASNFATFSGPYGDELGPSYSNDVTADIGDVHFYASSAAWNHSASVGANWAGDTLVLRGRRLSADDGGDFVDNYLTLTTPAPIYGASFVFQGWNKDRYWVHLEYSEDGTIWTADNNAGFGIYGDVDRDPDSTTHLIAVMDHIHVSYVRIVVSAHPNTAAGKNIASARVGLWSADLYYD